MMNYKIINEMLAHLKDSQQWLDQKMSQEAALVKSTQSSLEYHQRQREHVSGTIRFLELHPDRDLGRPEITKPTTDSKVAETGE